MKVDIQSVHFTADLKLTEFIEEKTQKLEKVNKRIINLDVILKLENSGQVKDKIVEMIAFIPGNKVISKSVDKTFENATDEAVSQLERQLRRLKEKQIDRNRGARI